MEILILIGTYWIEYETRPVKPSEMIDDSDAAPEKVTQGEVAGKTFRLAVDRKIISHIRHNFYARYRIKGQVEMELHMVKAVMSVGDVTFIYA